MTEGHYLHHDTRDTRKALDEHFRLAGLPPPAFTVPVTFQAQKPKIGNNEGRDTDGFPWDVAAFDESGRQDLNPATPWSRTAAWCPGTGSPLCGALLRRLFSPPVLAVCIASRRSSRFSVSDLAETLRPHHFVRPALKSPWGHHMGARNPIVPGPALALPRCGAAH